MRHIQCAGGQRGGMASRRRYCLGTVLISSKTGGKAKIKSFGEMFRFRSNSLKSRLMKINGFFSRRKINK